MIESISVSGIRNSGLTSPILARSKLYGMTAITDKCDLFHSPCTVNNGDCPPERICLANQRSQSGRSCICANSTMCNDNFLDIYK